MNYLSYLFSFVFLVLIGCSAGSDKTAGQNDQAQKTAEVETKEAKQVVEEKKSEAKKITIEELGVDTVPGLPNSDKAKWLKKGKDEFLRYDAWIVKLENGGEGSMYSVYERGGDKPIYSLGEMVYFSGISGKFLFATAGETAIASFWVYDLKEQKRVAEFSVEGKEPIVLENGKLTLWTVVREAPKVTPDCPDAEKWKGYGLDIAYKEKVIFNLEDGTLTRTGTFKCIAMS